MPVSVSACVGCGDEAYHRFLECVAEQPGSSESLLHLIALIKHNNRNHVVDIKKHQTKTRHSVSPWILLEQKWAPSLHLIPYSSGCLALGKACFVAQGD